MWINQKYLVDRVKTYAQGMPTIIETDGHELEHRRLAKREDLVRHALPRFDKELFKGLIINLGKVNPGEVATRRQVREVLSPVVLDTHS